MLVRILIPIVILACGIGAWKWLGIPVEEPQPTVHARQKLKTERLEMSLTDFPIVLETQGTVRAHHSTTITSLVPGTIRVIHPCFEDGAFFNEGEILAELDPADLQAALTAAESRLARADALLAQEEARAKQAKLNWQDIGYQEEPSPLVLRVPQLNEARAVVSSARADVDQAQRNLERTKIRAPFDGRVKSRMVGLGQAIGGTTPLGEVFTTDYAEIRLPLTAKQLPFVHLPSVDGDPPVKVILSDALGGDPAVNWQAHIVRTEGTLDESSRELFVIARIDDPFGRVSGNPELRIGQPVRAAIEGVVLKDVHVIPRSALRGINRIFLIEKNELTLNRVEVEPVFSNAEVLVVREGLQPGDWLATSRLPYAPSGAPVEIIEPAIAAEAPPSDTAQGRSGS
jgi:RND family efflux transporter MFP subunit